MKKFTRITLAVGLAASVLGFTSCVRSYNCRCTISYSGQPGLPDTAINDYDIKDTHTNAEKKCEDASNTSTTNGITTVETCRLY